MTTGRQGWVVLRHGTTRRRAEAILRDGPSLFFKEPGSSERTQAFSTAPAGGPFPCGTPEEYAAGKAAAFPDEGGPAILEIEVPENIVRLARPLGDIRFEPGFGFQELIDAWPTLPKRIL